MLRTIKRSAYAAVAAASLLASGYMVAGAQQAQDTTLKPGESWSGTIPASQTLSIDGRIDYPRPAGANYVLQVSVNGQVLTSPLTNKGQSFQYQDGRKFDYQRNGAWILFYSPDFSSNDSTAGGGYQVVTDPGQSYHYSWDISSLVGGKQEIDVTIKNVGATYPIIGRLTTAGGSSIFPIKELGGCTDKNSCRAYCSDPANGQACLAYAQAHGMMKADEVAKAKKMLALTQSGGTPGGCKDQQGCESYCSDSSHGDECIAFAEKNGMMNSEDVQQAKKVLPLLKSGQGPGGCTTKDTCQQYCSDSSHAAECASFAEKAGFISKEEADMVRKTGGKGPGGCTSKDSCESFCNQKENQQACFDFAKQHNLIPEEQLQKIEKGTAQLRAGLSQMPQQVVECLTGKVGSDTVSQIQNGQFVPNKDIGDAVQGCFEQFKPQMAEKIQQGLKNATPEVTGCLQNVLGTDGLQQLQQGGGIDNPDTGDKVKNCFEKMKEAAKEQMKKGFEQMNNLPQPVKDCVSQQLGSDFFTKLQSGDAEGMQGVDENKIKSAVMQCVQQQMQQGGASGTFPGGPNSEQLKEMMQKRGGMPGGFQGMSDSVKLCLQQRLGVDPTNTQALKEKFGGNPEAVKSAFSACGVQTAVPAQIQGQNYGPTPDQVKKMMQQGGGSGQGENEDNQGQQGGFQGGPTPDQIKQMMQKQFPQGSVPPQGTVPQIPNIPQIQQ